MKIEKSQITFWYRTRMFIMSFGIPLFGTPGVYFGIPKVVFGIRSFRILSFGTPSFGIPGYTQIYTVVVLHSKTYMPCRSINLRTHTFMIYEYSGKSGSAWSQRLTDIHDVKHFSVIHHNIKIEKIKLMHTVPMKSSDINLRIKILAVDVRHITAWR